MRYWVKIQTSAVRAFYKVKSCKITLAPAHLGVSKAFTVGHFEKVELDMKNHENDLETWLGCSNYFASLLSPNDI